MRRSAAIAISAMLVVRAGRAETEAPPELREVSVIEHLGDKLPRDLPFTDASGRPVRLGDYFDKGRPIILSLVYFDCPMMCSTVLSGLVKSFDATRGVIGKDADFVTVSFNPADEASKARERRRHYLQALGLSDAGPNGHF